MKWVVGAGFDWTNTAPAEMILARHVEILRADATLLTLFGGVAAAALGLIVGRRIAGVPEEIEAPEDAE